MPAFPDISLERFKRLNPNVNPNLLYENHLSPYKLPYDPGMEIKPPAELSGNCPKTLLLHTELRGPTNTNIPSFTVSTPTRPAGSQATGGSNSESRRERTETSDETTILSKPLSTPITPTKPATTQITSNSMSGMATKQTESTGTAIVSKNPSSTFNTLTAKPAPTKDSGAKADCFTGSNVPDKARREYQQTFCNVFKKRPFTYLDWWNIWEEADFKFELKFIKQSSFCKKFSFSYMKCKSYIDKIEETCQKQGGWLREECMYIAFEPLTKK